MLTIHSDPKIAAEILQKHITKIEEWLAKKKIKVNPNKCNHITFTLCKEASPDIKLNNLVIPQTKHVKYLGMHLDVRLMCKHHIKAILENIRIKRRQIYWLTSKKSKLSLENKLAVYKTIVKQIWTYGIPFWRTAAKSHIVKLESMQSKILKTIADAPWYIRNKELQKGLQVPAIVEEIEKYSKKHEERITSRSNELVTESYLNRIKRRPKRKHPADLTQ